MEKFSISELGALLTEQTQRLGPDHTEVLATRHLLARRIAERNGYAQAVSLYEHLVIDRTRVLGEEHRDTLTSRHNLALCLAWCGHLEKSRTMFEDVLRLLDETYGRGDDDSIRTRRWYLNDVLAELEPAETVIHEYETLFKTISHEGRKRVARNREIRRQYEKFLEINDESATGAGRSMRDDDDSLKPADPGQVDPDRKVSRYEPKLESWHAKLTWGELNGEIEEWQTAIASDAREISRVVVGRVDTEIKDFLHQRFHGADHDKNSLGKFEVLQKLVGLGSGSSMRLATQLALAYVDFAYFSVHIAGADPEAYRSEIDNLRQQLREVLGSNMDTTSAAEIEFEKSFRDIVGLETVKSDLMKFIRVLTENKRQLARGGDVEPPRLHLAFVGNPGTGKTTVARLYGRLLYQLGLMGTENFVEIDKSKIIGPYQGDPERMTRAIIEKATPGVLFIDEAYSLNDKFLDTKGPGERALEVIIKLMEDNRASLAVILAGYKKEMDDLMKVNPGLSSRIGATIEFPNYSLDELMEVARRSASKRGLRLDDAAEQKLNGVVGGLLTKTDFGNAREIESIIEEAQRNLLTRLAPLDDLATTDECRIILGLDIPLREQPVSKRVGFR